MAEKKYDELLITTLATGGSVEHAARQAGISQRSVYRRMADPVFKQKLRDFQTELIKRTAALLTAASLEAVRTLLSLMERTSSATARLGAARTVLEMGLRLRETAELEERLTWLEKQMASGSFAKGEHPPGH